MTRRLRITADLRLEAGPTNISIQQTDERTLLIRLSNLSAVGGLPLRKARAFRLLRRASRYVDQTIKIAVGDRAWLSCRDGRLSVHDYSLTLKAFFTK